MWRTIAACQILAVALIACIAVNGQAQVMGEEAELDRLRAKAEDAMGNDDAETAAMSMGRAALMAAHLSKRQTEPAPRHTFKATEHLYRSQEHGYRAIALFRRAGGELPASAGVCGSLQLAQLELRHAQETLSGPDDTEGKHTASPRRKAAQQSMEDWSIVLDSMQGEFHCPS
ncbi:MAG: hypothetical protein AABZ34_10550 [Nitrospirota bacterium]